MTNTFKQRIKVVRTQLGLWANLASNYFAPVEEHARRSIGLGASIVARGREIGALARGREALLRRFKVEKHEGVLSSPLSVASCPVDPRHRDL